MRYILHTYVNGNVCLFLIPPSRSSEDREAKTRIIFSYKRKERYLREIYKDTIRDESNPGNDTIISFQCDFSCKNYITQHLGIYSHIKTALQVTM